MIPNVAVLEIANPHFRMPRLWIPLIPVSYTHLTLPTILLV